MSIIRNLFNNLFSGSKKETFNISDWQKQEREATAALELKVRKPLIDLINEHHSLLIGWESGGDEAFLTINVLKGVESHEHYDLEEYLIMKLEIPSAGEFEMTGSGKVYIRDGKVHATYQTVFKTILDYNEETEEEVWSELEEETYNVELFTI